MSTIYLPGCYDDAASTRYIYTRQNNAYMARFIIASVRMRTPGVTETHQYRVLGEDGRGIKMDTYTAAKMSESKPTD